MSNSKPSFDTDHALSELVIILSSVGSVVRSTVTCRAQRNNETRIIRPTIANPAEVMRLQIWRPVPTEEGCLCCAALAPSMSSAQDVVADGTTALVHVSISRLTGHVRSRGPSSCFTQRFYFGILCRRRLVTHQFVDDIKGLQFKHKCLSHVSPFIWRITHLVPFANVLTFVTEAARCLLEEQQALPIDHMVADCLISTPHSHWSKSTRSEIFKYPVGSLDVMIPVLSTLWARHRDNEREIVGRNDASLLLTAKPCVNVVLAVIDAAASKSPRHTCFPLIRWCIEDFAAMSCGSVNAGPLATTVPGAMN